MSRPEMVFKLYGLIYEEVKVVCLDFWLGAEEYEGIKVDNMTNK